MTLADQVRALERVAARQGLRLYGYAIRADGSASGMFESRPDRGSTPVQNGADPISPTPTRRGVRPEQESLF